MHLSRIARIDGGMSRSAVQRAWIAGGNGVRPVASAPANRRGGTPLLVRFAEAPKSIDLGGIRN